MREPQLPTHQQYYCNTNNADIPLKLSKIIMSLLSYGLFFTDIPRSGYGFDVLPDMYNKIAESSYSYWGPYNYTTYNLILSKAGSMASTPSEMVAIWPYKFDTCSIGLRSLVQHF
ncbi:hypothetical protein THRCLA_22941, partial [Thraustotheca clavata]